MTKNKPEPQLCQFFVGSLEDAKEENNSCCSVDGQNCDDPTKPCHISFLGGRED